jgi:phosphoglycolate phosphatase-like HAD superfamily hydrolase
MVGDSGTDIKTARAAGVPVIAVDFGYADVPVEELGSTPSRLAALDAKLCWPQSAAARQRFDAAEGT